MKNLLSLILALSLLCLPALSACGEDGAGKESEANFPDVNTKTAISEIMQKTLDSAGEDVFVPKTFDDEVTVAKCQDTLGLTPEQFEQYVSEAYSSVAAITNQAFLVGLVKCKDAKAAAEVKKLIAENFNHNRWICVLPEQCFAVEAGNFVLLGAVYDNVAEILQNSFSEQFEGKAGTVNKFYERGEDEPEGGGNGFAGGLPLG